MEVTFTSTEISTSFPDATNLGECIAAVSAAAKAHNRVVCEIIANGIVLTEEKEAMYKNTPLSQLDRLSFTTQDIETLLDESRGGCVEFLGQLAKSFEKSADRFRAEDLAGAHRYYASCVEGAQLFMEMLGYFKTVYESARGQVPSNWGDIEQLMVAELRLVLEAYEQKNYILVADLLEYELTEIFKRWQQELTVIPLQKSSSSTTRTPSSLPPDAYSAAKTLNV